MGGFSRSLVRKIREVFPASDVSVNNPKDVSDDVQFTADYLPGTLRLDELQSRNILGAAGAPVVDLEVVPDNRYWWVLSCHMFHTDPAARPTSILLRNDNLGVAGLLDSSRERADGANFGDNLLFGVLRTFVVPPGWRIRASTDSIVGGGQIDLSALILELPLMERCPYL